MPYDTVVIKNEYYPKGLTELDIITHYQKFKPYVLNEIQNKNVVLVLAVDVNKFILRRNLYGKNIIINKSNYDNILNGRIVSIFQEVNDITDKWYIDIDKNSSSVRESDLKDAINDILKFFNILYKKGLLKEVVNTIVNTSTGYHIITTTNNKLNINDQRIFLEKLLEKSFKNKYGINDYKFHEINLDLSIMKPRGCHIVKYALNRNGLICVDITKTWEKFQRHMAIIKK